MVKGSSWQPTPWSVDTAQIPSERRTGSCRAVLWGWRRGHLSLVSCRASDPLWSPHAACEPARAPIPLPRRGRMFLPTSLDKWAWECGPQWMKVWGSSLSASPRFLVSHKGEGAHPEPVLASAGRAGGWCLGGRCSGVSGLPGVVAPELCGNVCSSRPS